MGQLKVESSTAPAARYNVRLVDLDYYLEQISCQAACPVRTDARGYVSAVAEGNFEGGYIQARQPNPFASICGRVCAAHCEKVCRRGKIDKPVAIRALKRALCESSGVEAKNRLPIARAERAGIALLAAKAPSNTSTADAYSQLFAGRMSRAEGSEKPQVAIIGAGPAGLTAAHDLTLLGYAATVFEAAPDTGGMTRLGIPEFRLPRDLLKLEIDEVLDLGVELRLNTRLGEDFTLSSLREQGFQATFIAIGAHKDQDMGLEGSDLDGVIPAVDFLLNVNLGYRTDLGERVVVIGGGDVAVDAARVAARLGEETYAGLASGNVVTAVDAAREALRLGARDVHMVYRGTRAEMKASEEELDDALEEGTVLHLRQSPLRIVGSDGKVTGLETVTNESVYDAEGNRTLVPVAGSEMMIECDSVLLATGQQSDLSFIRPEDAVEISNRGRIVADDTTLATTAPGVYAGGDVVFGPRTIIEAVADGHRAAKAIHSYLTKGRSKLVRRGWMSEVPPEEFPDPVHRESPRVDPPKQTIDRRTGVSEVEGAYDDETARRQAQRCLQCNIQTVFDGGLCILCGGCADVCPNKCLKLVPADELTGSGELAVLIAGRDDAGSLAEAADGDDTRETGTAIIKDETRCTRCGLCRNRCPVGAITMEAIWFEEELVDTGAVK